MFLNNLVICSIPFVGIVFLLVGWTWSNRLTRLSSKRKKRYSATNGIDSFSSGHVAIHVNPFSQLNDVHSYRQRTVLVTIDNTDDDEELIQSDLTSISALSYCEHGGIELRLDQDVDFVDVDVDNRINHWSDVSWNVFHISTGLYRSDLVHRLFFHVFVLNHFHTGSNSPCCLGNRWRAVLSRVDLFENSLFFSTDWTHPKNIRWHWFCPSSSSTVCFTHLGSDKTTNLEIDSPAAGLCLSPPLSQDGNFSPYQSQPPFNRALSYVLQSWTQIRWDLQVSIAD